jgi:endo-alpha-1,4-polygalactosaminidase (GH114 family)
MLSKLWFRIFFGVLIVFIGYLIVSNFFIVSPPPKTFRIYYEKINTKILVDMTNYDLNIVEASFFTKDDVEALHTTDSKIVGYLSLVEIGHWDTILVADLLEEDYLLDNFNKKLKSRSGSNYLGDLSSKHFREVLMKHLKIRILNKGMDGVFFDTLDWIDYYASNERLSTKLKQGYETFLIELKKEYPNIIIVQNRGLESYRSFSKNYIDVFLWENFDSSYPTQNDKKILALKEFRKIVKKNDTEVYVISFKNEEVNRKIICKFGWSFIFSQMENRYSEWDILQR